MMDRESICFLCRCHGRLDLPGQSGLSGQAQGIDLEQVGQYLEKTWGCRVKIVDALCRETELEPLTRLLKKERFKKILVCACADPVRQDLIRSRLKIPAEKAVLEMVDIREGCAWIHGTDREAATRKAMDLTAMGLGALEHARNSKFPVHKAENSVLIAGAGPAGLGAARALARAGIRVHLVEKSGTPGGMLNLIDRLGPGSRKPEEFIRSIWEEIKHHPLVTTHLLSRLTAIDGDAGRFTAGIVHNSKETKVTAGAVILATGARAFFPKGLYRYGEVPGVISTMELEQQLKNNPSIQGPVIFIQCVGFRNDVRPYCSAICCPITLKNAIRIKEQDPFSRVTVLHRDMICPGKELEAEYRKARSLGVIFSRFDPDRPPEVQGEDRVKQVSFYDATLNRTRAVAAQTVVINIGLVPNSSNNLLSGLLKPNASPQFLTVYPLMHPVETPFPGVFACGSARWPTLAQGALAQGEAAAMKAFDLVSKTDLNPAELQRFCPSRFGLAEVADTCMGCGNCVTACPFEACSLMEDGRTFKCRVNAFRCYGCGTCMSVCPSGSIQVPEQNSGVVHAMMSRAFDAGLPPTDKTEPRPRILIFACGYCGIIGAKEAGRGNISMTEPFRVIRVECASRVEPDAVIKAFSLGVDGVAVLGCHLGGCRYHHANSSAALRLNTLRTLLDAAGIDKRRLLISWGTAHESHQFAGLIRDFSSILACLAQDAGRQGPPSSMDSGITA